MSEPQAQEEGFLQHLIELRDRLIRALLAVLIIFICVFPFAKELYALLAQPLIAALPAGGQMIATDVVGVFLVPMKVALLVAFLIALPYVLFQVWAFVAPGLYSHEKKLVLPLVAASVKVDCPSMTLNETLPDAGNVPGPSIWPSTTVR